MTTIAIKDLRKNLAQIANHAQEGKSYTVYRHSKPSFKIVPIDTPTDEKWETVIDFTNQGKKAGEPIEDVISALENMN